MKINKQIKAKLAEVDKIKKRLDEFKPFDTLIEEYFKKHLEVVLTYDSNAIEGSTLSINETKGILEKGLVYKATNTREILEVINHRDAIRYLETLKAKPPYIVSIEEILNLHREILKGIQNNRAGKFRTEAVYIRTKKGTKNFPEWKQMPKLVKELLQWLRDNEKKYHPVLFAAELHYRFVSIHPFTDGNGRTARLLMNLILLQNNYPYANISVNNRVQYIEAITTVDETNDMTKFYLIVIEAVIDMLKLYIKTYKERIIWK